MGFQHALNDVPSTVHQSTQETRFGDAYDDVASIVHQLIQETRVRNAYDDVASTIHQSLLCGTDVAPKFCLLRPPASVFIKSYQRERLTLEAGPITSVPPATSMLVSQIRQSILPRKRQSANHISLPPAIPLRLHQEPPAGAPVAGGRANHISPSRHVSVI